MLDRRAAFSLLIALTLASASAIATPLEDGDRAWADRAEVLDGGLADPARIEAGIRHYRDAREADPRSVEASWKLLRALHYAIDFTTLSEDDKETRVLEATEIASATTASRDAEASDADLARLLFWSSIAWGTRAQRVGLLTIVREDVATRMRDFAQQSLQLDPTVDRGGALRLLSRLHATLPRVPFVSGWVDRGLALSLAERAYATDAAHPGNRLILALALLEQAPERSDEATALLESVVQAEPRVDFVVEDGAIRDQARERLETLRGETR